MIEPAITLAPAHAPQEEIRDFYERTSTRFANHDFGALSGRDEYLLPLIPTPGDIALEYGFGRGGLLPALALHFKRIIGVELSQSAIDRCAEALRLQCPEIYSKIKFVRTSGTDLPAVEDSSIDVIVAAAVVEHVFDPYRLMDELRRVAKPGAVLVLTTPNLVYLKHRLTILCGGLPKTGTDDDVSYWRACGWDGGHLHYFTKTTLHRLLADCGWAPEKWFGSGDRWPWLRPLRKQFPTVFSGELIVRAKAV